MAATTTALRCSFCGRSDAEVDRLVAGPGPPPSVQRWEDLDDDALLAEMVRIHEGRRQVDDAVAQVVRRLRERSVTWARIGEALGMTRQSAWERFSGED